MRYLLCLLLFFHSFDLSAQALTAKEQRDLYNKVQALDKRLAKIEGNLKLIEKNSLTLDDLPSNMPAEYKTKRSKKEMIKEIWNKMKLIIKNKKEQQDYMKELDEEDKRNFAPKKK